MSAPYLNQRVESIGSIWMIDDQAKVYVRMPKYEGPRPNGWGEPDQGLLADLVRHPFIDWHVEDHPGFGRRLKIHTHNDPDTGKPMYVVAPMEDA